MNLIERVQGMLLKPRETWASIAQEASDAKSIYRNYLVYLAAIPAVANFIGFCLIGSDASGVTFKLPILVGLANMVVGFGLTLVMVYVLALLANALAPAFQGENNLPNAFRLMAYASTASLLGGIFSLLPSLSMLGFLAALYSVYLIYTGIPVLMKAPQKKAMAYTLVLMICSIGAAMVLGGVSALFTHGSGGNAQAVGSVGTVFPSASSLIAFKVSGTEPPSPPKKATSAD